MSSPTPQQVSAKEFLEQTPDERQQYLDNGGVPPTLQDEQVLDLPPAQRDDYFRARADAGIDDDGMGGWIERISAQFTANSHAEEMNQRQVDTLSKDAEYVDGLPPSGADYLGQDHGAMKQYVSSVAPDQITDISTAYHELHQAFDEFATDLKDAVATSRHEWEGGAADNAHGYFTSLSTWADGNAQNAQLASEVMYQQSDAGVRARNSMPEPVPFSWENEMKKWGSNPFDLAGNIDQSMQVYQRSQDAHNEAARVMTAYDNDLFGAASRQPVFAEPPQFGDAGGSDGSTFPEQSVREPGDASDTKTSGFVGGSVPSGSVPGGSVPGGGGSGWNGMPSGGGSGSGSSQLAEGQGTGVGLPVKTRPSGYEPPGGGRSRVPSSGGRGGTGAMPIGAMGAGSFGPGGGGGEYAGKFGRSGGMGAGFGPGGGSGAAAGPGAGARLAGGAVPGASGAASAAGRPPMAAGMGRGGGMGGEDEEHQRPTYLVEGDPDEVFGTDERTAPPVIGE
jgi:hypothetical protein